jgi:Zn finger protein HypA/HybF involved in hydrogenase expression
MRICKKCNGTDIKSRRNYSHGKKSKTTTTFTCKKCGSTNIEVKTDNYKKNKRRG